MCKLLLINKYCKSLKDTGSTSIQIILITFKINNVIVYLKSNKNDNSCKRSLLKLLGKRFKLLKYLKKNDKNLYISLINDLNLKKIF